MRTGVPAALAVLESERFRSGDVDTHLLAPLDFTTSSPEDERIAAVAAAIHRRELARRRALEDSDGSRRGWLARSRSGVSAHATPGELGGGGS